jgi:hypothetical protein
MLPERAVGALCLGLAAVALTWGGSFAERSVAGAGRRSEVAAGRSGHVRAERAGSSPAAGSATTVPALAGASSTTIAPAPSTTTTAKPAPTTTTVTTMDAKAVAAAKAADEGLAQRTVLGSSDMLPGYVVTKQAPAAGAPDTDSPFERCLGADSDRLKGSVRAKRRSAEFAKSQTGSVSSSSAVFTDAATAGAVVDVLGSPAARTCFEELINARLASNPNLPEDARGTLTPVDPGKLGDQAAAFRFQVMLPAEDVEDDPSAEEIPYIADFVFVRRDRVLLLFEFGSLRQPFPAADARSMASSVSARI